MLVVLARIIFLKRTVFVFTESLITWLTIEKDLLLIYTIHHNGLAPYIVIPLIVSWIPLVPAGADGPYDHGVVAADASLCSEVGRDILKKNGSAVDSAIATSFCIGVINMHSAGIGGGGFMTIYNRSTNKAEVIDYREEAPGKANSTMYINSTLNSKYGKIHNYWRAFDAFSLDFLSLYL